MSHNHYPRLTHSENRRYLAVLTGCPDDETLTVDVPIARHPTISTLKVAVNDSAISTLKSRTALTHFRVLVRGPSAALCEIQPVSGRTRQKRVHSEYDRPRQSVAENQRSLETDLAHRFPREPEINHGEFGAAAWQSVTCGVALYRGLLRGAWPHLRWFGAFPRGCIKHVGSLERTEIRAACSVRASDHLCVALGVSRPSFNVLFQVRRTSFVWRQAVWLCEPLEIIVSSST